MWNNSAQTTPLNVSKTSPPASEGISVKLANVWLCKAVMNNAVHVWWWAAEMNGLGGTGLRLTASYHFIPLITPWDPIQGSLNSSGSGFGWLGISESHKADNMSALDSQKGCGKWTDASSRHKHTYAHADTHWETNNILSGELCGLCIHMITLDLKQTLKIAISNIMSNIKNAQYCISRQSSSQTGKTKEHLEEEQTECCLQWSIY